MNLKKIAGWTAVLFVGWFIITQPGGAAGMLQNMGNSLESGAEGMSTFFTTLF